MDVSALGTHNVVPTGPNDREKSAIPPVEEGAGVPTEGQNGDVLDDGTKEGLVRLAEQIYGERKAKAKKRKLQKALAGYARAASDDEYANGEMLDIAA